MENYKDDSKWVYEEFQIADIQEHSEFTLEELASFVGGLFEKEKEFGLEGSKFFFLSTLEPYANNFPGPVSVLLGGYRKATPVEKQEYERRQAQEKLAKELGVSYYEAGIIQDLKNRGKL